MRTRKVTKNYTLAYLFISCVLLMVWGGCGKSTPQCSDDDVKDLVIEIATGEIKNQLTTQAIATEAGVHPSVWGNPSYDTLKQQMEGREDIKGIIDHVDKQLASISMKVDGIRTNAIDEKIKKCQCGASLALSNGKSLPIEYTAQYTEDKKIYVEVSGL